MASSSIKGTWRAVANSSEISRSSQVISVTGNNLSIFGGEIKPRQPVDNKLYHISLADISSKNAAVQSTAGTSPPTPRVGSSATTLNTRTYLFSGRGGEAMAPLEENGSLQVLDHSSASSDGSGAWSVIHPADPSAPYPPARSYHAMTSDGSNKIYLHAGCPASGRLSDLWTFDLSARTWKELSPAPGPARGGTSLAFLGGKVWRMNGFDGKNEQGFALDCYDPTSNSWEETKTWDVNDGPSARSVSALLPVVVDGKECLLTLFGESDPSSLGHQGAGRMLDDVWAFDVKGSKWMKVEVEGEKPQARGWFAADVVNGLHGGKSCAVVHGGLAEDNTRLGDVWMLTV